MMTTAMANCKAIALLENYITGLPACLHQASAQEAKAKT
jgi:hypothetical protein